MEREREREKKKKKRETGRAGEQSGRPHRSSSATVFTNFLVPLRRVSRAAGSKLAFCACAEGWGILSAGGTSSEPSPVVSRGKVNE